MKLLNPFVLHPLCTSNFYLHRNCIIAVCSVCVCRAGTAGSNIARLMPRHGGRNRNLPGLEGRLQQKSPRHPPPQTGLGEW